MDLYRELREENGNILENCKRRIMQHQEIVLYGAGVSGTVISKWLQDNNIFPKAFVDSNPDKVGTLVNGIKVYQKQELGGSFGHSFIIVSCGDYAVILEELMGMGVSKDRVMYIDPKWIICPNGLREFIDNNISRLQEALELLEDDLSRNVFVNMLKYKVSYNIDYIKAVCSNWEERYFDSQLMGKKEIKNFVDAGGYTGDTVDAFIRKFSGGGYSDIYVFEPNKANMQQLRSNMENNKYHNIHMFEMGLSDKAEELYFDTSSGIATRIDKKGKEKIVCDKLDNVLGDKQVDLIKMDIEGSELRALVGSERIIKKYKPILAICVYHKPEDYYEIPIWIKKICPNYKIYFRQYELSDTETICYAIGG